MRIERSTRRNRWSRPGILVVGLALVACRGETPVPLDDLPVRTLEPGPTIHGFRPGLGPVRWVGQGPDSSVALGLVGDHLIRIFDADGAKAASVGGPVEGARSRSSAVPLQGGAGWVGDTLWVQDASLGRILLYHPVGERTRSLLPLGGARPPAPEEGTRPSFLSVWPLVLYPGDTLLVLANHAVRGGKLDGEGRRLLRIGPDGRILRDVARVPVEPELADTDSSPPIAGLRPSSFYVAPGGDRIGLVEGLGGDGSDAWRLLVLTAHGDTLLDRGYRVRGGARPRGIVLGSDGRIWLTIPGVPRETWWLVLGPEGDPQARLEAPALGRILGADQAHLWVSEPGPDGTLGVVRYRILDEDSTSAGR